MTGLAEPFMLSASMLATSGTAFRVFGLKSRTQSITSTSPLRKAIDDAAAMVATAIGQSSAGDEAKLVVGGCPPTLKELVANHP